jgi:Ca-activated chloride channel family protein
VRPGLSRVSLAAQAAIGAGKLLPDGSAIGLWSFAGRQAGGRPYRKIAAIDLLRADHVTAAGVTVTHRDAVRAALTAIPRQLTPGGTSLYDTALAALREAREKYDPKANNAVVLFTDGANDYARGISLRQFEARARADARSHPRQPVALVSIGIGPQADMRALAAMSAAAGGRAYQATSVAALRTVLFDAVARPPVPAGP